MQNINNSISHIGKILDENYTKKEVEIELGLKSIAQLFVNKEYYTLLRLGVKESILENAKSRRSLYKDKVMEICAIPFASKQIYELFLSKIGPELSSILKMLIWNESVHEDEIEKELGTVIYEITEKKYGYYGRSQKIKTVNNKYNFFKSIDVSGSWYPNERSNYSLYLPEEFRRILTAYYPKPKAYYFNPVKSIKDATIIYTKGEVDILNEFRRIYGYMIQGRVDYTNSGRPTVGSINKMIKQLRLKEFYSEKPPKELKSIRTTLITGLLGETKRGDINNTPDLIRNIFRQAYRNNYSPIQNNLLHLRGLGYLHAGDTNQYEKLFFDTFKTLPQGEWISIENILDYFKYRSYTIRPVSLNYAANKIYISASHSIYMTNSSLYNRYIVKPYISSTLFLYAGFGLLDVAYNTPNTQKIDDTYYSAYDGLKYVRLTKLGEYVFGISNSYSPPQVESSKITLSEDSLMIIVEKGNDGLDVILEVYAEKVSTNRFVTQASFFLKDCQSKRDLESKISLFKENISTTLPANWEAFFNELRQKINPFKPISNIKVFSIPADNKTLIRLIATDKVLKDIVIKAEGFNMLIQSAHYDKFKRRLKEFGYLMTK